MGGGACSCKSPDKPEKPEGKKACICMQCNTFKSVPVGETAPECCGKQMTEMD
jgi:hypothetical protein